MAFEKYSTYIYGFHKLNDMLGDETKQEKYYCKWMKKYGQLFSEENSWMCIEWDLRCRRSMREIFSSAMFLVEAKKCLETKCFSSYFFCLYYSLFHAIFACDFLNTETEMRNLLQITHSSLINTFISAYGNSKNDLFDNKIKELFEKFKNKREYYSYVTPFNNVFNLDEEIKELENILLQCYQLASFHSLLIEVIS